MDGCSSDLGVRKISAEARGRFDYARAGMDCCTASMDLQAGPHTVMIFFFSGRLCSSSEDFLLPSVAAFVISAWE